MNVNYLEAIFSLFFILLFVAETVVLYFREQGKVKERRRNKRTSKECIECGAPRGDEPCSICGAE